MQAMETVLWGSGGNSVYQEAPKVIVALYPLSLFASFFLNFDLYPRMDQNKAKWEEIAK